jgi:acyl-CoA thioesterase-2
VRDRLLAELPFDIRTAEGHDEEHAGPPRPARRAIWWRAVAPLPDVPALHRYLLAYASDYGFIPTALLPHGVTWFDASVHVASLDHAMWFHRPLRVDDWLLYVMDSPVAFGGRGLVRGRVFSRDGRLVASTAQEGLIRRRVS